MDQRKIGSFLKELRKEKGLTQEQLAEKMSVSGRTVSRWETGSNMPDLDILIELSDLYDVDIRELLDGERKSEKMDQELKETIEKVADYSNEMKKRFIRNMHWMFLAGVLDGIAEAKQLIADMMEVPADKIDKYGMVAGEEIEDGVYKISAMVEKWAAEELKKEKTNDMVIFINR